MKSKLKLFYLPLLLSSLAISSCDNNSTSNSASTKTDNEITTKMAKNQVLEDIDYNIISGEYFTNNLANISSTKDTNYVSTRLAVNGNDRYLVSFELSDTSIFCFAITNKYNTVIKDFYPLTKNGSFAPLTKYINVEIICPDNSSTLFINSKASFKDFSIKKIVIKDEKLSTLPNIDKKEIRVGANNIGEFEYGESTYTNDQYKEHWNNMLSSNNYDLFMFEDCVDTYLDGSSTQSVLGNNKSNWLGVESFGSYFHSSTDFTPISQSLVLLPHTIKNKSTRRYIAYKTVYLINGKLTAFYALHLIAEDHITTKDENGINYLSRRLRQRQFQVLIDDSKYYDEACFLGDFNANDITEYQYFVERGFSIANGSEKFGTKNTLIRGDAELAAGKKNIPADNIIVSKGLSIDEFKILDSFNLNTDHMPVYGVLNFGGNAK